MVSPDFESLILQIAAPCIVMMAALGTSSAKSTDSISSLRSTGEKLTTPNISQEQTPYPSIKRSLAIREKALGPEHPKVGESLNDLATLYRKMGKAEDASKLEERAQKIISQSGSR